MIEFKLIDGAAPKAVQVITDDHEAELAAMTDALADAGWEDSNTAENLAACTEPDADGRYVFSIPGDEAGDVAEMFIDTGIDLWAFLASANRATLGEALKHQE